MKDLAYLNKFLVKYRRYLIPGILFIIISNVFAVLPAQVIRLAFDLVTENMALYHQFAGFNRQAIIYDIFGSSLLFFGLLVLALALISGLFTFLQGKPLS